MHVLLFRTIQELVINVLKHAKAQHVTISISKVKNKIHINVVDDGIGFNIAGIAYNRIRRAAPVAARRGMNTGSAIPIP